MCVCVHACVCVCVYLEGSVCVSHSFLSLCQMTDEFQTSVQRISLNRREIHVGNAHTFGGGNCILL